MRTHGGLTPATALLLLFFLITRSLGVDVKISEGKTKRATRANRDANKIIVEEIIFGRNNNITEAADCGKTEDDPGKINSQLLALLTSKSKAKRSPDQQADQSQAIIIDVDDLGDLEKLEHALSLVDYEPQRISATKRKRKTGGSWRDANDLAEASNESASQGSPAKSYYEVARASKPRNRKTGKEWSRDISPRGFSKSTSGNLEAVGGGSGVSDPVAVKRRLKPATNKKEDLEYEKSSAIRRGRGRRYNNRLQVIPEVLGAQLTPAEGTKFEDIQAMKPAPFSPAYSASSNAVRRTKYVGTSVVGSSTAPAPAGDAYAARSISSRKSRNEEKSKLAENSPAPRITTSSYNPSAFENVSRNPVTEAEKKSRRFGLLGKYERAAPTSAAAPRAFVAKGEPGINSADDEGGAAGPSRQPGARAKYVTTDVNAASNRPIQVAAERVNNGKGRDAYGGASSQGGFHPSPAQQVNPQGDPTAAAAASPPTEILGDGGYKKSEEPDKLLDVIKVGSVPSFNAHKDSAEIDSSRNANPNGGPLHFEEPLYASDPPTFGTTAPSAQLASRRSQSYENINTLPHASQTSQKHALSTVIPYTTLNRNAGTSEDPSRSSDSLDEEDRNARSSERTDLYRSKESASSEEIAQASSLEAEQQDDADSRERARGYATRESPNEGRSVEDSSKEGSTHHASHHDGSPAESKAADSGSGGSGGEGGVGGGHGGKKQYERGGGSGQGEDHHRSKGEKGEKGYKSWHEDDKASKGHHDKERHTNYYDENDGKEKESKEQGGYHEEYKKGEKGEKAAEFGETGQHEKGHSTKGQHVIHKKDEFEKKTEFFDEYNEEGDIEKDGGFLEEHEFSKGGHEKSSHHKEKKLEEKYGEEGKHEKGGHYSDHKGRKISEGKDSHYDQKEIHGKKGGHQEGKKWGYKHAPSSGTGHQKAR